MIEALASDRADEPLEAGLMPRLAARDRYFFGRFSKQVARTQTSVEHPYAVADVPIAQTVSQSDRIGRLSSVTDSSAGSGWYFFPEKQLQFSYDVAGNPLGIARVYDYDPEGNLILRTDKSSGEATRYAWDHRNRLVSVLRVPPPPPLNFSTAGSASYSGQDGLGVPDSWIAVEDSGRMVHLKENTWRWISFSTSLGLPSTTYTITANTVLSFDFFSPTLPEIAAIGLDNDNGFTPTPGGP